MDFRKAIKNPADLSRYKTSLEKEWLQTKEKDFNIQARALKGAMLIYVQDELVEVIRETVGEHFDGDILDCLPAKSGVVYLGGLLEGQYTEDGKDVNLPVSGFIWAVEGNKLYRMTLTKPKDLMAVGAISRTEKKRIAKIFGEAPAASKPVARLVGREWTLENARHQDFLFLTTMHLLSRKGVSRIEIGKVQREVPKPFRSGGRGSTVTKTDDVSIAYLRPLREVHATEENGQTLTCRFLVRGHFRNQPYKSTGEVKKIFIDPYIKGPQGAPMKKASPVYVADRKTLG